MTHLMLVKIETVVPASRSLELHASFGRNSGDNS